MLKRLFVPGSVFLVCAGLYLLTSAGHIYSSGAESNYGNHYVHLARSFLAGQLHVLGNTPPGHNDYAVYQGKWYVSFPPFPAILLIPFVAIWDLSTPDRLIWNILAGLAPALLYVLLRFLRERKGSQRTARDDLLLTALFAFGTVYYFTAVQGTVWFAGHVVVSILCCLYMLWAVDARRPFAAGLALGLAFISRPTTAPLGIFFVGQALQRNCQALDQTPWTAPKATLAYVKHQLRTIHWHEVATTCCWFALPIILIGTLSMWINYLRFDDVFEFGHRYLNIRWQPRIDRWGLFSYHYLPRNLAIFLASLPWILKVPPFVSINGHGLALWFTTPNFLTLVWPRALSTTTRLLYFSAGLVALYDLCYQNTGWVQFGYRFALDYMIPLMVLLALSGRRFGKGFMALAACSIIINTFGAITFDRMPMFYFIDPSQQILFQPD